MAFASLDDINLFLPDDKIEVDSALYVAVQLDAERVVRGYLAGYVPATTLVTWITPDNTPGLIRAITGRLGAAFRYRERYSEDSLADPQYALTLYNEAIDMLVRIQSGTMVLEEVPDLVGSSEIGADDFFPNADTPGPYFTMDQVL